MFVLPSWRKAILKIWVARLCSPSSAAVGAGGRCIVSWLLEIGLKVTHMMRRGGTFCIVSILMLFAASCRMEEWQHLFLSGLELFTFEC